MINSTYLYSFFIAIGTSLLIYLFLNFKTDKNDISNKILLKNLLEGLDVDLPEELKNLDNSTPNSKKLS